MAHAHDDCLGTYSAPLAPVDGLPFARADLERSWASNDMVPDPSQQYSRLSLHLVWSIVLRSTFVGISDALAK